MLGQDQQIRFWYVVLAITVVGYRYFKSKDWL